MIEQFVWAEKYRPHKIEDCILPSNLKKTFEGFLRQKDTPNLLLTGGSGMGKTTVARALLEELDIEYLLINGSLNGNIDTVRSDIAQYASTVSLTGKRKFIILDEADYLNANSTMPALRGFLDEFSAYCGFIFTANFPDRLLAALHSRCAVIEFHIPPEERKPLKVKVLKLLLSILDKEIVKHDPKAVLFLMEETFPDIRRTINELQRFAATGEINLGMVSSLHNDDLELLANILKEKKFNDMRKWMNDHPDVDFGSLVEGLYERLIVKLKQESIPQMILTMASYDHKHALVTNKRINMEAMLTEIMLQCMFK